MVRCGGGREEGVGRDEQNKQKLKTPVHGVIKDWYENHTDWLPVCNGNSNGPVTHGLNLSARFE